MKILFPLQPVDRREFGARLRGMGFVAATDPQANDCTRQGIWRREADAVGLIAIGAAGVGVITIGGPDQAALAGALAAAYPSRSEGDVIAGARVPSGEAELPSRVRALFELAPLLMLETFAPVSYTHLTLPTTERV